MRDKRLCKMLLERLLQTKIKDIVYLEEEKAIDIGKDAKSVRLDVYLEDGNRVFDLEMQTTDKGNLPKRSRYYQGMIDLNTIEKGENYKKLVLSGEAGMGDVNRSKIIPDLIFNSVKEMIPFL